MDTFHHKGALQAGRSEEEANNVHTQDMVVKSHQLGLQVKPWTADTYVSIARLSVLTTEVVE